MLTKEQAAATWCPMVRIARHEVVTVEGAPIGNLTLVREEHHIVGGCNTDALGRLRVPASCCCIADRCAMWRWGYDQDGAGGMVDDDVRVGYCGLAGRPGA